jgi:hypothetical protein
MAGGMIDHGVNLLDQNLILTSKSKIGNLEKDQILDDDSVDSCFRTLDLSLYLFYFIFGFYVFLVQLARAFSSSVYHKYFKISFIIPVSHVRIVGVF